MSNKHRNIFYSLYIKLLKKLTCKHEKKHSVYCFHTNLYLYDRCDICNNKS